MVCIASYWEAACSVSAARILRNLKFWVVSFLPNSVLWIVILSIPLQQLEHMSFATQPSTNHRTAPAQKLVEAVYPACWKHLRYLNENLPPYKSGRSRNRFQHLPTAEWPSFLASWSCSWLPLQTSVCFGGWKKQVFHHHFRSCLVFKTKIHGKKWWRDGPRTSYVVSSPLLVLCVRSMFVPYLCFFFFGWF